MPIRPIRPLRIGLDLDGVVAQFNESYRRLLHQLEPEVPINPAPPLTWSYEVTQDGFDRRTVDRAWTHIRARPALFWGSLPAYPGAVEFAWGLTHLGSVSVVTARPGNDEAAVRDTSAEWVRHTLGIRAPVHLAATVPKAQICRELELDVLIDDCPENVADLPAHTRGLLLDRPWNAAAPVPSAAVRVWSYVDILRELSNT